MTRYNKRENLNMPDVALKKKRPLWHNLSLFNLPLPGLVSILHRLSGALLFLLLPGVLYMLDASLSSAETFAQLKVVLSHPFSKLILLGLIWAYMHHLCAGIRFLILDLHIGTDLPKARASSRIVLALGVLLTLPLAWALLA
jgi:succinate dehydrogenase / fumarate reductase cytochrome b subunit